MKASHNSCSVPPQLKSEIIDVEAAHLSLRTALSESDLLNRVIEFRQSGFKASSSATDLSTTEAAARAEARTEAMLALKQASEQFNGLVAPVDDGKRLALQHLQLEELLSTRHWHALLLAPQAKALRRTTIDRLCGRLLEATHFLNTVQAQFYQAAKNSDESPGSGETATLGGVKEELKVDHRAQSRRGAIVGLISGSVALLLLVLAMAAFAPGFTQLVPTQFSTGSIPYRLLMILMLLILVVAGFMTISTLSMNRTLDSMPFTHSQPSRGIFASLFDIGASPRRIIAGALGPALLGLGLGISISAGFGTFGFSVLLDGIYKTFEVPFWVSQTVLTIVCYLLAWGWGRVPLGLGTITTLLLVGPAISFGAGLPPENLAFIGNLMAFLIGLFFFATGISLAAAAALGPDGVTALSLAAERRHQWPVPRATFLWDITAIAAGMILGGNYGVATLIGLLTVPFIIHILIPPLRRLLH